MQYVTFIWDAVKAGVPLALIAAVAYVVYVAATKGVPAAWTLVKGWFGDTKRAVIALEARVSALEKHTGITPAAPTGPTGVTGPAK